MRTRRWWRPPEDERKGKEGGSKGSFRKSNLKWWKGRAQTCRFATMEEQEIPRKDREKRGFNASINSILNFDKRDHIEFLLDDSKVFDIVDKSMIETLLKKKEFLLQR